MQFPLEFMATPPPTTDILQNTAGEIKNKRGFLQLEQSVAQSQIIIGYQRLNFRHHSTDLKIGQPVVTENIDLSFNLTKVG